MNTNNFVIYKATFPNNKVYIGKSKDFKNRLRGHNWSGKKGSSNHIMSRAIRKYGFENIKWEIIHECSSSEEMSQMEIFYIKEYNSIDHEFGYNMVCGDKEDNHYDKRKNIDPEYQLDVIKKKLEANGHNPDKYVVIDDKIGKDIIDEYVGGGMIRRMSKKYKISRNRLKRFLLSNNVKIVSQVNTSLTFSEEYINKIIEKYKNGETIKDISEEENLTIMIVSRILHDSGIRKSKRFKNGKRYDGKQPKRLQNNLPNRGKST